MVAQGIAQGIDEMIGTFFVNQHPAAVDISGMEHAESIAGIDDRLHIGAIGPGIDVALFCLREAIDHTSEHFAPIYAEYHSMYTEAIVNSLHVVVGTYASTYPSPGCEGLLGMRWKAFGLGATHHTASTLPRKKHDTIGTRCGMVVNRFSKVGQGVDIVARSALKQVKMKMGTERVAGVTAHCNHLTSLYRVLFGATGEFNLPAFATILQLLDTARSLAYKGIEVAIDGRVTVVIDYIEHVA